MARKIAPVPKGYRTATPCLIVNGIEKAIEFYSAAFNATTMKLTYDPTSTYLIHGTIKIGNSIIALQQESVEMGILSPLTLGNNGSQTHLYIEDVDALWTTALQAGATPIIEPVNAYWGDRTATLIDTLGHRWTLASRVEHVSETDMKQRSDALFFPATEVVVEQIEEEIVIEEMAA